MGAASWYAGELSSHDPRIPVHAYLEALRTGNVDDALKDSGYTPGPADVLLDFNAYDDAKNTLSHYTIAKAHRSGSTVTVTAQLTFGSKKSSQTFRLRTDGDDFMLFPRWKLVPFAPGEMTVQLNGPTDAEIYADGSSDIMGRGVVHLRAFPGTYTIGLSGDDPHYAGDLIHPQYYPGIKQTSTPKFDTWLSDKADARGHVAVTAWLASCLKSGSAKPQGCLFGQQNIHPDGGTLTDQTWTLEKAPTVEIGPWDGTGFPVVTTAAGAAAFHSTLTLPDGRQGTYGSITDSAVVLVGHIKLDADTGAESYEELDLTAGGSTPQT